MNTTKRIGTGHYATHDGAFEIVKDDGWEEGAPCGWNVFRVYAGDVTEPVNIVFGSKREAVDWTARQVTDA